jgi:hypothetical protein
LYTPEGVILWSSFICKLIAVDDTLKPLAAYKINDLFSVLYEMGASKEGCDAINEALTPLLPLAHTRVRVLDSDDNIFNAVSPCLAINAKQS